MYYELDTTALQRGYTLVLLLPYHCHYRPFELTGAQAKIFANKSNAFRSVDVE
jgi:hypothetical protein